MTGVPSPGARRAAAGDRSPLLAALASAVLPGSGQWYAGARRRALAVAGLAGVVAAPALLAAASLVIDGGPRALVRLTEPFFRTPRLILVLLTAQVVVVVFHAWVIVDAWRIARAGASPPDARKPGWAGIASLAVLLTAALALPHLWVAQRALALHDLLTFDFSVDRRAAPDPAATTTPATGPAATTTVPTTAPPVTTSAPPATTSTPPTIPASSTTTQPATTTTGAPESAGWQTIALLGGDSGPGRWGVRTDTIIVVAIDPVSGRSALFSVPRNWSNAPLPPGHPAADPDCGCYRDILNSLYQHATDHADRYPGSANPGADALTAALEELLGIGIDDYALIDLMGFETAIDLLGGIDINVRVAVTDPGHVHPDGTISDVSFLPGVQHMDGRLALAYARARQETDDYHRMDRQRCVLEAVAEQADPVTILRRLPEFVDVLTGSLVTDIPVSEWPDLVSLLGRLDTRAAVSVRFVPNAPELAGTGFSYVGDVELVRATVRAALELPLDEAMATIGVGSLDEVCG